MKSCVKMKEAVIKFGDIEIQKQKFNQHKGPISIKNLDINKIVVSNTVSLGKKEFKYFIGYKRAQKIRPWCIFLAKMSTYRKDADENKYIYFLIKDDELLKKCNKIWEKAKNSLKKEFHSEPVYNEKYLKARIKSYNGKISTSFHHYKIQREVSQFICLSVILIYSVFRTGKNYYPQVPLMSIC